MSLLRAESHVMLAEAMAAERRQRDEQDTTD